MSSREERESGISDHQARAKRCGWTNYEMRRLKIREKNLSMSMELRGEISAMLEEEVECSRQKV